MQTVRVLVSESRRKDTLHLANVPWRFTSLLPNRRIADLSTAMVFNSLQFFIFFPVVTGVYFSLPNRFRWGWLLLASCYFYMAFIPLYILILLFTIALDFAVGLKLETVQGRARTFLLIASLAGNIGVLAVFKYYYFIDENLVLASAFLGWNYSLPALSIILPIGLSFHTFQSMSYIIEVYRGNQRAERHLGIYSLYVMYYPQLVAGPIERPQNLLHQLREYHPLDYGRVRDGLQLMLWGLFKKVAIADQLADTVDLVYGNPAAHSGLALVVATLAFGFQIYCDFSGYSDIAIGASRVMGVDLMQNFRQPYFSRSISEFWRRWHISLSTWFRDYLYAPLGGNRRGPWRTRLNLLIVFLVSGLWHGANWAFIAWGCLHGAFLIAGQASAKSRERLSNALGLYRFPAARNLLAMLVTFSLVNLAWIFFRSESLSTALLMIRNIPDGLVLDILALRSPAAAQAFLSSMHVSKYTLFALCVLLVVDVLSQRKGFSHVINCSPVLARWAIYYGLGFWVLVCFANNAKQFIYFQF